MTNSASYSVTQNYLTPVGAFTLADSYYGTFDQGGNVWEFNDAIIDGVFGDPASRGLRGGTWGNLPEGPLQASFRSGAQPTFTTGFIGFRIATVPEPSATLLLAMAGLGLIVGWRGRSGVHHLHRERRGDTFRRPVRGGFRFWGGSGG